MQNQPTPSALRPAWPFGLLVAAVLASVLVQNPAGAAFEAHPLVATPSADAVLIVGDLIDANDETSLDRQLASHLAERFNVTIVVDDTLSPGDIRSADVVVLSSTTSSAEFEPFLLKASVPIVALKASSWTALGLAPFAAEDATPLQELAEVVPRETEHPILHAMETPIALFADGAAAPVGQGWTADTIPEDGPQTLADGPAGAALFVYAAGSTLNFPIVDAMDVAPACRVGFPSHGGTRYSDEGLVLLQRSVLWASSAECQPPAGQPLTPSLDASMCRVDPADETQAFVNGEIVDIDPQVGRPNLSSLWVRALAHDPESDVLYVGGRFDQAYDAADVDPESGELGEGVRRDGLFACDLATGTVTDFEVPLLLDSLGVTDAGRLINDRVRALALHGDHLYVGGRFLLGEGVDPGELAVRGNGVHNLIRVDRITGEIDTTWSADVRGGVSALAVHGSFLYVSGGIHAVATEEGLAPAARLARLDLETGAADLTFLPMMLPLIPQADGNLFASVSALEIVGDTLLVGGSFDHLISEPTTDDWIAYASTVGAQPVTPWPAERATGVDRNAVAAFDLSTSPPSVTEFAPSLGDNNLAGGDVTAQIRDIATDGNDAVFVCGDWWLSHPEPGLTWIPYDADTAPEVIENENEGDDVGVVDPEADVIVDEVDELDDVDLALEEPPVEGEATPLDPNDPGWEGQRSLHQPRPNQHNIGRFDLATGASALSADGGVWGATTDGGIQACDYDPTSDRLIIGGHHESIGAFDPDFVDDPDVERYPDSHRPLEKVNAIDGATGEVLEWDSDLNSVRGVDAVLILPGVDGERSRIVIGGAFNEADRMPREGLAMYAIEPAAPLIEAARPPGGLGG